MNKIKNRKGIILAGGYGTRLYPVTKAISKHLLPIYDKPMIFYSLSLLFYANIKTIQLISTSRDINSYKVLLGNGSKFGIKIFYKIQKEPKGIAHAIKISKKFIGNSPVALVLGDNFLFGKDIENLLRRANNNTNNATIFLKEVNNANSYGVAVFKNNSKKLDRIIEKPKNKISNYAVTGIYFYNNNILKYIKKLKYSKRGELEITDLNNIYIQNKQMNYKVLGKEITWMDCGTTKQLNKVSNYVKMTQNKENNIIGFLEGIAFSKKWITKKQFKNNIEEYGDNDYGINILRLLKNKNYN